ncbi:MAG: alpha/beta hydrolase [Chloroflexi bacterium]|nr:alpha/beta hydrolase [Chloroflexota bacterium]MDA1145251.1 alpha/beta hydrolase [Chloroflexota bacterium]
MPAELTHHQLEGVNGLSMHVAEQGAGPAIVLSHGWPELWYSWRHQIPVLAEAGFRVLAPDQRGYGGTTAPEAIEAYTQRDFCGDLVGLLDKLEIDQAIFIGHDWGGAVVWNMALHFPERVRAVAGVNTPFRGQPPLPMLKALAASPGMFDYQFYFQEPGVVEAEVEADVERSLRLIFRSSDPADEFDVLAGFDTVRERGGILAGYPPDAPRSVMLTEEELNVFVESFQRTGFRGAFNWYRNSDASWEWGEQTKGRTIDCPALMVTAGKDPVLTPAMAAGMESVVPNLTRGHIENCAHWTQQERPEELNRILLDWLATLPK